MTDRETSLSMSLRTGSSFSLPQVIRSLGHSPEALFETASVDLGLYDNPESRISVFELGRLFDCAAQATGRSDIGLIIADNFRPDGLGLVGELAAEGPDVNTALKNLVRLLQYNTLAGYPTLSIVDGMASLGFDLRVSGFVGANFILDGATGIIFRFMQWLCGKAWKPEEVHLSRRAPEDNLPFEFFFGVPVKFSATEDAVLFTTDWLKRHVVREERRKKSKYLEIAAAPFSELVRRQVAIRLGLEPIDADGVATELGVSRRNLFRRLNAEKTTYRKVADEVRFSRARHLLDVGDAPIAAIAYAVGYLDQTAFTRAYARWSGMAPGRWRKGVGGNTTLKRKRQED